MLAANSGLPSVSYVRPSSDDDMQPAQNNLELVQAHLRVDFDAIFGSFYWQSNQTAALITFDENGRYFDHVPPYGATPTAPAPASPASSSSLTTAPPASTRTHTRSCRSSSCCRRATPCPRPPPHRSAPPRCAT